MATRKYWGSAIAGELAGWWDAGRACGVTIVLQSYKPRRPPGPADS